MKVHKIYELAFDTDETITTATLSKSNEIIILVNSGNVIRFNLGDQTGKLLFSVKSEMGYSDGGFDTKAKISIYTINEIVIVVNDFKIHGFVHYPGKYDALHLRRENYYGNISTYPIALYKNAEGVPHLIFGEAWNHLQIVNLDTRQVLTASKSLIEENAEEKHIELYKKYDEVNKLLWPRPYDYFFGKLLVSPKQDKFLSTGWIWGSFDSYHVYEIEKFINSNRISDLKVGVWEHENRAACWVNNETIAVVCNPFTEGEENSTVDSLCEIHFHKIIEDDVTIEKKIQIADKNIAISTMYFNETLNSFIIVSNGNSGLAVISLDGQTAFKDENLKVDDYCVETGRFLMVDHKTILVYELTQ
jgi:hypothetical protein